MEPQSSSAPRLLEYGPVKLQYGLQLPADKKNDAHKTSIFVSDYLKEVGDLPIAEVLELPDVKNRYHIVIDPNIQKIFLREHRFGPKERDPSKSYLYKDRAEITGGILSTDKLLAGHQEDSLKIRKLLSQFFKKAETHEHLEKIFPEIIDSWLTEVLTKGTVQLFNEAGYLFSKLMIQGVLGYTDCEEKDARLNVELWAKILTSNASHLHHVDEYDDIGFFESATNFFKDTSSKIYKLLVYKMSKSDWDGLIDKITSYSCSEIGRKNQNLCAYLQDQGLTQEEIRGTVLVFLFTGLETTKTIFGSILYQYAKNPAKHQEHALEIAELREENKDKPIAEVLKQKKSGCWRFLNEALRIYTPGVPSRTTDSDMILKCPFMKGKSTEEREYYIRKGEQVICMPYIHGHDPKIYPNPDQFNSDRDNVLDVIKTVLPFGYGSHHCPGEDLANQEILTCLAIILPKVNLKALQDMPEFIWHFSIKPLQDIEIEFSKQLSVIIDG